MNLQYQLVNTRPLNAGGNGDLILGQRSDTGEWIVRKYLREHQSQYARAGFRREARVLNRKYRGLIRILDSDTEAECPYYDMPYLSGGCLTTHAGRLSESQLLAIAIDLASTLADVHARFDAHGDVKPDNILVTHDGHLQVADPLGNGINCTIIFAQNHGGTPGYWAPEISAGGAVSAAGDVHAYGATLYHLATGRRPYDGQRLDLSLESCLMPFKIKEVIMACGQPGSADRPSMKEVLRILGGECWIDIQAANQRSRGLAAAVCVLGGLILLLGGLGD